MTHTSPQRAGSAESVIAVICCILFLLVPVGPGTYGESSIAAAVLFGLSFGCSVGAVRFASSGGFRVLGWIVLGVCLLLLVAFMVKGIIDRAQVYRYWMR